jgi:hypothetical protein
MSSDADYEAFLDKVNQPATSPHTSSSTSKFASQPARIQDAGHNIPASISSMLGEKERWYTSEVDEKWEGVSLKWSGEGKFDEGMWSMGWMGDCVRPPLCFGGDCRYVYGNQG